MRRVDRVWRAALGVLLASWPLVMAAGPVDAATRGAGSMLVRQDVRCAGTGTTSTVFLPFSLWFSGFSPHETGTVAAYTQPGGALIGSATITLDSTGRRCVEVVGEAPPGRYKIVYDFGSGTGKQKVIRLVDPPVSTDVPTAAPSTTSASPTSASPTTTSASPTTTSASPTTTSASPTTTSASPSTTSASPTTTSASPTSTGASPTATSPSATGTSGPGGTASPSATEPGHVEFIPEDLAPTGASAPPPSLPSAVVLLVVGGLLLLLTRRGTVATADRRH